MTLHPKYVCTFEIIGDISWINDKKPHYSSEKCWNNTRFIAWMPPSIPTFVHQQSWYFWQVWAASSPDTFNVAFSGRCHTTSSIPSDLDPVYLYIYINEVEHHKLLLDFPGCRHVFQPDLHYVLGFPHFFALIFISKYPDINPDAVHASQKHSPIHLWIHDINHLCGNFRVEH